MAAEYVRSVNAGAAICHLHGPYTVDAKIQADGTKLSDLDIPGWRRLRAGITGHDRRDHPVRHRQRPLPAAQVLMEDQRPDMVSTCFNAHDECFDYEPGREPVELYAIHDREELRNIARSPAGSASSSRSRPSTTAVSGMHANDGEGTP